jgi:hypothetical protein
MNRDNGSPSPAASLFSHLDVATFLGHGSEARLFQRANHGIAR